MMTRRIHLLAGIASLALGTAVSVAAAGAQIAPRDRDELIALGRQYPTANALYQALLEEANGGQPLDWNDLPDWSGVYTRARGGIAYDPDAPPGGVPEVRLTPEYEARYERLLAQADAGNEWDPISTCAPPGHPRWLTEPFLRDFVVTPDQTYLINEMVNDIRRIYTDGRGHTPEADRYPLYNGDSVGFWDGHKLVIHTNQLMSGIYQRRQPEYTDQVETVEIWEKINDTTIEVDVWVYDPPALVEPWYTKQAYARLSNDDKALRIRYWYCGENPNNAVFETEEGGTDFIDFTFTEEDDR